MDRSLADIRRDYAGRDLSESDVDPDPIRQFTRWLDDAISAEVTDTNAMVLATVSPEGQPRARTMLLKGVDEEGFVFYTNCRSAKARDLEANPRASLCFLWRELERQVRVEGTVVHVPHEESDAYFATRPRGSQIGAWASPQSEVIPDREALDARARDLDEEHRGRDVPRPPHWGGYRLLPATIEFWQGRRDRLHDRLRYRLEGDQWVLERLAP